MKLQYHSNCTETLYLFIYLVLILFSKKKLMSMCLFLFLKYTHQLMNQSLNLIK